jgi:23S rRNA G2445 N2-methylase RlmL
MGVAPGLASRSGAGLGDRHTRRFAFMEWPDFDPALWGQLVEQAQQQNLQRSAQLAERLHIAASDRDAGAIEQAQANAARAGVADQIEFGRLPVSAVTPCCEHGWIVTNPPYGLRVSGTNDVRNLYAQFGNILRTSFRGWQLAVLCNERQLIGQIGLPLDTSLNLVNGGLAVILARGRV